MIYLIGDIHGDFRELKLLLDEVPKDATVIQVGDLGVWPFTAPRWKASGIDRDVYFIDGNHDYIPWLDADSPDPVEIWPHAIYVPRGYHCWFPVDGVDKHFLFLGGSKSVDRAWRKRDGIHHGWFDKEQLSLAQAERAMGVGQVDFMITHTPPESVIRQNFSPSGLEQFDIDPLTWVDESAKMVETVWKALGEPRLICGHMHRSLVDGQVRILNTNEVFKLE